MPQDGRTERPAPVRRLVVSTAAEARLDVLRSALRAGAAGERLIVAPTRGAADDLVRRSAIDGPGLFGLHRANFMQLAHDLATEPMARRGLAPVSALGAEALAARGIHRAGTLDYFAPVAMTPGFPRALSRTLRELRCARVAATALAATGAPGADLARLLTAYDAELRERGLADHATICDLATEVAAAGRHRLVGLPLLLLDLAPRDAVEVALLGALAAAAPSVDATALAGDEPSIAALTAICGVEPERLAEPDPTTGLERLRRYVFLASSPDRPATPAADERSVEFFSAPGEGRECVELVRRVVGLARSGIPFDRMAVLLRDPFGYQGLIEDAMRRAGVPVYFTHGTVRPDPSGRALLALLHCAAEGLSATRFAEYLSLGQVPALDAGGAPRVREVPWVEPKGQQLVFKTLVAEPAEPEAPAEPLPEEEDQTDSDPVVAGTLRAPWQWERLIVDAAVVGGRDRWARRLDGLRGELEVQLREIEGDDGLRVHLEKQIERLGHLARFALPVIDALAALPQKATWGDWLDQLDRLAGTVLRRHQTVRAVLGELRPMAEVGPVEIDEVIDVLTERLTALRVEPPKRRYGMVFVATLDEARGRAFDVVFLPGLAEGIFPRKAVEDPLLLDQFRRPLAAGLADQSQRVADERRLLRIAAAAARAKLVVSYPRVDVMQGRARVPSFYALDVLRAAEGRLPELADLEKRAAGASASHLGWPAPRDGRESIDDAEYDLALLHELLQPRAELTEGRGRFLLDVNPHLARSLRTRWHRWAKVWSPADGLVDPDDRTKLALLTHLPTERSYSPTALQNYAGCPYRFLLQAVHRLRPRDEIVTLEQMDPLTRGSLFHEVQFELLRLLRARDLLPIRADRLDEVLGCADDKLDEVAARYEEKLAPAIPRVWTSEIEGLRTDLRGWIRKVIEIDERWRPGYFELAFGLPAGDERDPLSQADEVVIDGGVRLRGSIDLVEVDDAAGTLRVTDHKTGKAPWKSRVVISGGEILQPLLYGLVAEKMLGKPVETGRLFYCTQRGEYRTVDVPLDRERRELATEVLDTIGQAVREGHLPAAPRAGSCDWCDYKLVCGPYEEMRYQRKKDDPRLTGLLSLRERE